MAACRLSGGGITKRRWTLYDDGIQMGDLATLLKIRENAGVLRILTKYVVSEIGIVPFVGAGMSAPSGFPLWTEFLQLQAGYQAMENAITLRLQHGEYEEAAEDLLVARKFRRFEDAIQIAFDRDIDPVGIRGAVTRLPFVSSGPVITTNFDSLLEIAFKTANRPFDRSVVGRRVGDAYQAFNLNQRVLIKLHGDCASATDRVLTLSEYTAAYGNADPSRINLSLPLPRFLQRALQGRPLLFLGCGLNQDRTLRVLKAVVAADSSVFHFALVPLPHPSQMLERDAFLAEHGISPIWYPSGEHEFIDVVLEHLVRARGHGIVTRIAPSLTWPPPVPITYGTALSGSQLRATANVPGKFAYSPPAGTVLSAGDGQTLSAAFEPTDTTHHANGAVTAPINVSRATPTIVWRRPAAIIQGSALTSSQLNAIASVAGIFVYTPVAGTVLPAGRRQMLSVNFVPADAVNYASVNVSTTINVGAAAATRSVGVALALGALAVLLFIVVVWPQRTLSPVQVDSPEIKVAAISAPSRVVAVSSNHRWLAVTEKDGRLSLVDLFGTPPRSLQLAKVISPLLAVLPTVSEDDTQLATVQNGKLILVDARSGEIRDLPTSSQIRGQVELVEFSIDGKAVAFATDEGEIAIQPTDGNSPPRKLPEFGQRKHAHIEAIAFSRSGGRLAAASILAASVAIYDVADMKRISIVNRLVQSDSTPFLPKSVAFDSQGKWLATGDLSDGTVRIWNIDTEVVEQQFSGSNGTVNALSFDADNRWLAATGEGGSVAAWSIKAKQATRFFPSSVATNFFAIFSGPTLYVTSTLARRGQPALLVRIADNAGGLPNVNCQIDGHVSKVSDEQGVCFFPDLSGKHEVQVNAEKRSLDITGPNVVSFATPGEPHEWKSPTNKAN